MRKKTPRKREKIKTLLEEGWSTRRIAKKVKVSLRDVSKTREEMGLRYGIVKRKEQTVKEKIASLNSMYAKHKQELEQDIAQLDQQKKATADGLQNVAVRPIQILHPIHILDNFTDVKAKMESLNDAQFQVLLQMISAERIRRAEAARDKERAKLEEVEKRIRSS